MGWELKNCPNHWPIRNPDKCSNLFSLTWSSGQVVANLTSGVLGGEVSSSGMSLPFSLFVLSILTVLALAGAETHHLWILLLGSLTLGGILYAESRRQRPRRVR